ncbi:amidohydrolase family protein [Mycobacterium sp. CVI_P4]|uniref:2-amino-3-carboxymuconate-6-semialdehyde decarboxylase n=1 Tax=Mycobacterium pinniadriaticum TaxID=2994102 RepID=A0ABT3SH18_9MYCO|nr:amidohydrolase family protein [Mycobacterium pinniadriaticum]
MASRPPTGLIDVHTHAVDPDLPDLRRRHSEDRWPSVERTGDTTAWLNYGDQHYRKIDYRCWSAEARIADMDRDGVAMQVISPIPVTFCYDCDPAGAAELAASQNEFFARIVTDHPNRFAALGAVALQDPDRAVAELRRCMSRRGFLGVEIATQVRGCELADERFDRFFAVASELEAFILIHPRDEDLPTRMAGLRMGFGAGMPLETATAAASLLSTGALVRRPTVRLCLAHGGGALPAIIGRLDKGATIAGMPADSAELPSRLAKTMWCDSLTYNRAALLTAVDVFGADRVVFGSDYPFPAAPEPIGDIVVDLPLELNQRISRRNLERPYGTLPRTRPDTLSPAGRNG